MTTSENAYETVSEHPTSSAFVLKAIADQGVVRDQLFAGDRVLTTHSKVTDYDLESTRLALELESYMTGYAEALVTEYNILEAPEDLDFIIVSKERRVTLFFADKEDRFNAEIRLSSTYLPGVDQVPALAIGWIDRVTEEKLVTLPLSSFSALQKILRHPHHAHIVDFVFDIQHMIASYRGFAEAGRLSTHSDRLKLSIDGIYPVDVEYGIGSENPVPSTEWAKMEAAAPGAEHALLNLRGPQTFCIDGRFHPDADPKNPFARRMNAEELITMWGFPVSVYTNGRVVIDPAGTANLESNDGFLVFLIEHYRETLEYSGVELRDKIRDARETYRKYEQNHLDKLLDINWDRSETFAVTTKMTGALSDLIHDAGFHQLETVDGRTWCSIPEIADYSELHHNLVSAGWSVTHSGEIPAAMKAVLVPKGVVAPPRTTLSTPAERGQLEHFGRRLRQ